MPMTPERVTQRVALFIESIRYGVSHSLAEHHAALALEYIEYAHALGISMPPAFTCWIAVNDATDAWQPKVEEDGRPLTPAA
ncbi:MULTISPECIES: hypothetical protein [unclassified Pseudomonas]|uniref:hypothetical protein n=1 Tax=unclassified Pseudomonas TaxID=196821 RepID=UPI0025E1A0D6|nr:MULTISPECIES: hypothetical protein [unclassified Pseudomonas]